MYHVQRFEKNSNIELLTLDKLENDRPLFLCENNTDWVTVDSGYIFVLLKIYITKDIKSIVLPTDIYFSLFEYDGIINKFVLTEEINKYKDYSLFVKEFHPETEDEMFLINSRHYIEDIKKINI